MGKEQTVYVDRGKIQMIGDPDLSVGSLNDDAGNFSEGDIFRWSYRDPSADQRAYQRAYGSYHCCSRIAVFKGGFLRDTFWNSGYDDRWFKPEDFPKLELTFVANFYDLELAPEYQADYYDDADIVNLNHSNSTRGNFYLRKGAVRSQKKQLEVCRRKLENSLSAERIAALQSEQLRATISRLEAGAEVNDV